MNELNARIDCNQLHRRTSQRVKEGAVIYEKLEHLNSIEQLNCFLESTRSYIQELKQKNQETKLSFEFKWLPGTDFVDHPLQKWLREMSPSKKLSSLEDRILFVIDTYTAENRSNLYTALSSLDELFSASKFYSNCIDAMNKAIQASQDSWTTQNKQEKIFSIRIYSSPLPGYCRG